MNKIAISLILIFIISLTSVLALTDKTDVEKALEKQENVKVIIMLKDDSTKTVEIMSSDNLEIKKQNIKQTQNKVLDRFKEEESNNTKKAIISSEEKTFFEIRTQYKTINSLAGKINKKAFEELKSMPEVVNIYLDGVVHKSLNQSAPLMNISPTWALRLNNTNITGAGQTICVIDTGIDTDHPDFAGRILDEYCYCSVSDYGSGGCCPDNTAEDTSAEDDEDHGTHVAGIAAGNGSIYMGVAPAAGIISIKVLNSTGSGAFSDVASAIDWCRLNANTYNISVITMSLGDSGEYNNPTAQCDGNFLTRHAIDDAVGVGIFVTVASGNEGNTDGLNYPACVTNATSVGSTTKSDTISSFTNRDEILDLMATGGTSAGEGACPTSNYICAAQRGGGYTGFSGTSMATPQVAGAVALLQQFTFHQNNTNLTTTEIKNTLINTGLNTTGWPRINLIAAINSLDSVKPIITLDSPTNNSGSSNSTQNFTYTTTESGYCNIYINSSGPLSLNTTEYSAGGSNIISFNLTDNHWLWIIECNDSAGNIANATNNFTLIVDTIMPQINFTNITEINNSNKSQTYIEFNVNFTEINFANITWNLNGVEYVNTTQTYGWNKTGLSDGNYTYNATICDLANNCNTTETRVIRLDATPSPVSYSTITQTNNKYISRNYIEINVTYTEPNFVNITWNINKTEYTNTTEIYEWNETGLGDGNYSYNVTICDLTGNCNSTATRFIVLDSTYPVFNFTPVNQEINYSMPFVYDLNVSDLFLDNYSINNTNFSIAQNGTITNNTILSVGTHSLEISINDSAGNINTTIINVVVKLNQSQEIIANTSTNVSLPEANINLTLYINQSFNSTIVVSKETPTASGNTSSKTSVKGVNITLDNNTNSSMKWAIITIYYNDTDITGLDESSLIIYFYNKSRSDWVAQTTTINTGLNYVSANVTHFSLYGLFGDTASSDPPSSSGGGGGGGSSSTNEIETILTTIGTIHTNLQRNDVLKFTENSLAYSLKLTKVNTDNIEILFSPTNEKFELIPNQEKTIDLTTDKELNILLNSITSRKATLTLKKVIAKKLPIFNMTAHKAKQEVKEIPILNKTVKEELVEKTKKPLNILKWSIITLVLVILITGISYVVYERRRNMKRIREMI